MEEKKYDFSAIESKWQKYWDEHKTFHAENDYSKPKFYALVEFPYPSGQGLHVGHPRPFTAMDIVTRKKRMEGYNVLYPIGFDAFGLPTENYAIKNHIHPAIVTKQNIANFTSQLKMLGYGFDWDRCIDTTDPSYYKWTQWIFQQMFKRGLAYKATMPVNWCTSCKCVLANEEVVNGVCERCGSEVIRKEKSQWMLKITAYAQRLLDDLEDVDYIERVKIQQRNWIGRSTGAEITFQTNIGDEVTVYTTRADTLFGTSYMVISPEHPLLKSWQPHIKNWDAVAAYQEEAARKSDFERGELNKEKTGVRLEGIEAINPVTHKPLPLFVSDYVLMGYGTTHYANPAYAALDYTFKDLGYSNVLIGTVEAYPSIPSILRGLKELQPEKIHLTPFMIVAGDHATNDMAGEEEDSWKNQFEAAGYTVECHLKGLGEYEGIRKIFLKHIEESK